MSRPLSPASQRTPIIGLIGGVASGKSAVAQCLAAHGALVLDADKSVHTILQRPTVVSAIRQRFSEAVIDDHGAVNRQHLAKRVFGDSPDQTADRRWLEELIHPLVRQLTERSIQEAGNRFPAIVIDAPLLLEAGWGNLCDHIVLVDTPWPLRCQLAAARGWTPTDLQLREQAQMPIADKRRCATFILTNRGSLAELALNVQEFWDQRVLAIRTE